jgi:hypothetical protein
MAYFSPSPRLSKRIRRIGRKGRRAAAAAGQVRPRATIRAARAYYSRLLRPACGSGKFQPCRLHTKLIVLDDAVYLGSANFDARSLYINLEIVLYIEDAALARRLSRVRRGPAAGGREITARSPRPPGDRGGTGCAGGSRCFWWWRSTTRSTGASTSCADPLVQATVIATQSYPPWYSPCARSLNLVILGSKRSRTLPVAPWRCLAMISSARP